MGGMKAASGLLVPGLLALFIAIVCTEPMYWMIERGIPKWVAILVVLIGLIGLSSLVPLVITGSYVQFIQELPAYQERADLLFEQSSLNSSRMSFRVPAEARSMTRQLED